MRLRAAALLVLLPVAAWADTVRTVDHARLRLDDVAPSAPRAIATVDLGPAPPPGASRVVSRADVALRVRSAGQDPSKLKMPAAVRVVGAARRISIDELATLARPTIEKALPQGVTLSKVEPAREIVVPPLATVSTATVPKLPRQKGFFKSTAMVELTSENVPVASIPVSVLLDIGEQAAQPDVPRGKRVNLVIDRGGIRVIASAVTLVDANLGDAANVQVAATGRILKAKLTGRDEAEVMDKP